MRFHKALSPVAAAICLFGFCCPSVRADNNTTLVVDVSQTAHTISPLLFGEQMQWSLFGQDLLKVDSLTPTSGVLRTDVLDRLKPLHISVLRYPSGTPADFFHWNLSTGPYVSRTPLTTYGLEPGTTQAATPYFGADEFLQAAQYLNSDMMITANVGSGTASEAAQWLAYYKSKGVTPKYWEIGNEVYLPGNTPSGLYLVDSVHMTALQYAAAFDAFALALRAVDPSIQVGMIGVHLGAPGLIDWNQVVLQNVGQKVDFIAVHNGYAPEDTNSGESMAQYQAMLAAPLGIRSNMDLVENDIAAYAAPQSQGMKIAITEHSALWLPPSGADIATIFQDEQRAQSLGSALYSALTFQVFISDSKIEFANHLNPFSALFQAPLTFKIPNVPGFPGYNPNAPLYPNYDPAPVQSAYYHVFRLYSDAAGGTYVPVTITGSPTFDSTAIGNVAAQTNVPSLSAIAVRPASSSSRVYIYVVNRDLTRAIDTTIHIRGLSQLVTSASAEQLNAADFTAKNNSASPGAVQLAPISAPPQPDFPFTFPAHSLTRFTIDQGPAAANLASLSIFPNPLRPAQGHTQMNFTQVPPGARLRIYTLAGEKVRDLVVDASGAAAWDGTNQAGQKVASGVYFALLEGAGDKKTFKIAVQR